MIVTEETAKRIADSLERLEKLLKPGTPAPPMRYFEPPSSRSQNRCAHCHGFHGNGLACPFLAPTAGDI